MSPDRDVSRSKTCSSFSVPATSGPRPSPTVTDSPDLSLTLGWRISPHARAAARKRGVTVRAILTVVADPQLTYPNRGRVLMVRDRLALVTDAQARVVVTVLARLTNEWDDATARQWLANT